jgi:release factor glutamine methyltransferase
MSDDLYKQKMREINAKMELDDKQYSLEVNGIKIDVFPNVYSPLYFTDSEWFSKTLPEIVKKSKFLEIGSGTGIISLCVALNGADVTMTDINPEAVENSKHNFEKYHLSPKIYFGDMYELLPTKEKFDFIFWSHPFNKGDNPNESILFKSGFDYGYKGLRKYISEAHLHLNAKGKLLLGTGKYASLNEIEIIAREAGYKMNLLRITKMPVSKFAPEFDNDYRVYEFVKN